MMDTDFEKKSGKCSFELQKPAKKDGYPNIQKEGVILLPLSGPKRTLSDGNVDPMDPMIYGRKVEDLVDQPDHLKTGKFHFQAVKVFLTYAQCTLTPWEIYDALSQKNEIKEYSICQEPHQDGGMHIHAWIRYKKKCQTKDCKHWDIEGFHPNIAKPRSDEAVIRYTKKLGFRYISNITVETTYEGIVEEAKGDRNKFLSLMNEKKKKDMIFKAEAVEYYADNYVKKNMKKRARPAKEWPVDEYKVPEAVEEWFKNDTTVTDEGRNRFLLLVGDKANLGKTQMIFALCRKFGMKWQLWKQGLNMKKWDEEATVNIFDDVPPELLFCDNMRNIITANGDDVQVKRHYGFTDVDARRPSIIITNRKDWIETKLEEYYKDESLGVFVLITEPLFKQEERKEKSTRGVIKWNFQNEKKLVEEVEVKPTHSQKYPTIYGLWKKVKR